MAFFGLPPGMGEGDTLDDRIRRLAEADENLQIYDFEAGDDALPGLDESLDDFNDDTFGAGGGTGRDFDFAGSTAKFTGQPAAAPTAAPSSRIQKPTTAAKGAPSPFGFASFDADPLLGPIRPSAGAGRGTAPPPPSQPAYHQRPLQPFYNTHQQPSTSPFQAPSAATPPTQAADKRKYRTIEEIEAEMAAQQAAAAAAAQAKAAQPAVQPGLPSGRRPQTVEEIEADMMRQSADRAQALAAQAQAQASQLQSQLQQQTQQIDDVAQRTAQIAIEQQRQAQRPIPSQSDDVLSQLFPPLTSQSGSAPASDPGLDRDIEARIREAEAHENARRRKAGKIVHMARYNNLMTQGDKDFITRIQVSQLVNSAGPGGSHDPYVDDFYYVVMQSLKQSRALQQQQQQQQRGQASDARAGPAGTQMAGPPGLPQHSLQNRRVLDTKRMTRRESAMNRMAQQVQRLVDDAKKKPRATQLALEGALGKIAIRTRSAPRPLLQVGRQDADKDASAAAASSLSSTLNRTAVSGSSANAPMNKRQVLLAIERVYDTVLLLEQARRTQQGMIAAARMEQSAEEEFVNFPGHRVRTEARQALAEMEASYATLVDEMWKGMKVMEPLDQCIPHPFISIISVAKGKKLLPRVLRHTDAKQTLTLLTLLVATFDTLDVITDAPILDTHPNDATFLGSQNLLAGPQRRTRKQVEQETEAFLNVALPLVMATIGRTPLRIVTGMLGVFIERNDLIKTAKTKPGLAFLTLFVSRGHLLSEITETSTTAEAPAPDASELAQWTATFNHLFNRLSGNLPSLFPSTRSKPFGPSMYTSGMANTIQYETILDAEDEPVWHFLAALAISSDMGQQQALVTEARDKVLENIMKAKNAAQQVQQASGVAGEAVAAAKIRNVNIFLNALGLDASQLSAD